MGSTAKPDSGTFDRLGNKLDGYARDFGYEQMTCIWREALNPWVDNAPTEIKWAYADMLAGWDLVRYLVAEQVGNGKDKAHRDLIRKVAAAQWEDDKRVKFSQSDVDREKVVDLFVDVTADRVQTAGQQAPARPGTDRRGRRRRVLVARPDALHSRSRRARTGQVHPQPVRLPGAPQLLHSRVRAT